MKKKWKGAILNFLVPGLGNAYGRKVVKGILIYVLFFILVLSLRFTAYSFGFLLGSFTLILSYYVYLIIGGYRGVKKDHQYEPAYFDKWYVYVLVVILNAVFVNSIDRRSLDKLTPINFASTPTPSMEPNLLVGDYLAFRKTKAIGHNDLTVFRFPGDTNTMYLKRCIGLPGDSVTIKGSTVYINKILPANIPLNFKYLLSTDGSEINPSVFKKHQVGEEDYNRLSSGMYQCFLTSQQAKAFRELPFVKNVDPMIATEGVSEPGIYPESNNFRWNTDFYGPIYIPKKGDKIRLTDVNVDLYLKCIKFENDTAERDTAGLKVNGQLVSTYEFKESYFFVMGDNRHNSLDSRYWGLLPQQLVIGKAMYIYWSKISNRIGKKII